MKVKRNSKNMEMTNLERKESKDLYILLAVICTIIPNSLLYVDAYHYALTTISNFEIVLCIICQTILALYVMLKCIPRWNIFYGLAKIFFRKNISRWDQILDEETIYTVSHNDQKELAKRVRFKSGKSMAMFYLIACEMIGEGSTFCRTFRLLHMTSINDDQSENLSDMIEKYEESIRRHEDRLRKEGKAS